jgi:hypothetical protein
VRKRWNTQRPEDENPALAKITTIRREIEENRFSLI